MGVLTIVLLTILAIVTIPIWIWGLFLLPFMLAEIVVYGAVIYMIYMFIKALGY